MDYIKKETILDEGSASLGRRDVMKLGVGAGVAMAMPVANSVAAAQEPAQQTAPQTAPRQPVSDAPTGGLQRGQTCQQWPDIAESQAVVTSTAPGYTTHTGAGWVNNSGRASGNGPMDICTQRLVNFASSFSESQLTPTLIETINYLMADSFSALYSGFETDPSRVCARLGLLMPGPCTILGYGIKTSYETAAFANGTMMRHADFDDHNSSVLGGILAVGETLHSTGPQVMVALVIAYEVMEAFLFTNSTVEPGHMEFDANAIHGPGVALACAKLMGLNEDQMGNAVSLALLPHMPMYSRIGTQTMWKGAHSSEQVRNGVWAALLAREGMTGPNMPFEGRDGFIAHVGPFVRDLRLPVSRDGRTAIETGHGRGLGGYKRFPADGGQQTMHESVVGPIRDWAKPEEIASIEAEMGYRTWQETNDPPKWDPRNRETADHSMPYNFARHFLDGYIYLDSFAKEKYMDPKARELMSKFISRPNVGASSPGLSSITVRKISGEQRVFKVQPSSPMTHDDIIAKHNKVVDFKKIEKAQADRILKQWMNLKDVKDIGDAIATAAKFGEPRPLSDKSPSAIS